jgi:hypothetical protein
MRSPELAPAGLLVRFGAVRVMLDGGPGAAPDRRPDAWLVTDARAELIAEIRRLARALGCEPEVASFRHRGLRLRPFPVVHTSHLTVGYRISAGPLRVVWAPEFLEFPRWAAGADLMFADAASWNRRIWFVGRVGGHASVAEVSAEAARYKVRRLVLAHLGRPTLRAIHQGLRPPFGEYGREGQEYRPSPPRAIARRVRSGGDNPRGRGRWRASPR